MNAGTLASSIDQPDTSVPQLRRDDLESCPLGTVGNLQFNVEQGGTACAGRVGTMLSRMYHSLLDQLGKMLDCFAWAIKEPRAQREVLVQIRENSAYVGKLLGYLTARADDDEAMSKTRPALLQLVSMVPDGSLTAARDLEGALSKIRGGRESLSTYLDELSGADLIALHNGILGCESARKALLRQVHYPQQIVGGAILDQIKEVLQSRFKQKVILEPFSELADLLSAGQMDYLKLKGSLIGLARSLEQFETSRAASSVMDRRDPLDLCLKTLPDYVLRVLQSEAGNHTPLDSRERDLLDTAGDLRAFNMLQRIRAWLSFSSNEQATAAR